MENIASRLGIEDAIRAFEILSVGPTFFKGLIEKQIHLYRIANSLDNNNHHSNPHQMSGYLSSSSDFVNGRQITPAGYYTGVWCRDASFILDDMLESGGKIEIVMRWLEWIWQSQIRQGQRVAFGRGSPATGFRSTTAKETDIGQFVGALPSSIQYRYNEVYGSGADIDSTALMISVTCQFCIQAGSISEKFIPRIRDAIGALARKDIDDDGLLEQGPNEDWMDSMLRSGKVVYSQAVWAMALKNWSKLLIKVGESREAEDALQKHRRTIEQVNAKLWNENSACYEDMIAIADDDEEEEEDDEKDTNYNSREEGGHHNSNSLSSSPYSSSVTQDTSLFLLLEEIESRRALLALETLKKKLWTDNNSNMGPCCITPPRKRTGPLQIRSHNYQNGAFWPWITSFEIRSRIRHKLTADSEILLQKTLPYSFFEWINPFTKASGSYPFRTSIAAMRSALRQFLNAKEEKL